MLEPVIVHSPPPPIAPASPVDRAVPAWSAPARPALRAYETDQSWDLLLVCIAGYIMVAVGRVHQLFPVLDMLRPAILTGVGATALYWVNQHPLRRSALLLVPTTKYVFALLAWMAFAVPTALRPGASFTLLIDGFLKTVLMYLVIAGSVRGVRDVERLAVVYLSSAAVYAAVVLARFDLGSGDAWRLGHLYYYDANDFATYAVSAMPFGLYVVHSGRRALNRALAGIALAMLTLAFVYTGSRGGFIALVAMGCFIVARYRSIALRWRVSATALVAFVVLATASDQYWRQMSTITSDADYNRTAESGRLQIWQRGIGYMLSHPLLGVGAGNFQTAEGTLSPYAERQQFGIGVRWNAAHNSFVQIGAELGIPGLVLFLAIVASVLAALRRPGPSRAGPRRSRRGTELRDAIAAALVGFLVGAFFLSFAYSEMLYTLAALAVGLHKITWGRIGSAA